MSEDVPRGTQLGRKRGYGQLSESAQIDVLRSVKIRDGLTNKALAAKHNVSEGVIKGVLQRYRERVESTPPASEPTCQSEKQASPSVPSSDAL